MSRALSRRHCLSWFAALAAAARRPVVAGFTTGAAVAAGFAIGAPEPETGLGPDERRVALDAAEFGLYEIEAARLGARRAVAPAVSGFAATLLHECVDTYTALQRFADSRVVQLPVEMAADRVDAIDALAQSPADTFDERYLRRFAVAGREARIRLLEEGLRDCRDAGFVAWAARALAAAQTLLGEARRLANAR